MSFPSYPYLGQLHIEDSQLWRWNGQQWLSLRSGIFSLETDDCDDDDSPQEPLPPTSIDEALLRIEELLSAIESALNQSFLLID